MKEFKEWLQNYEVVDPPHGLSNHEWTKEQGIDHFTWFMSVLPHRMKQLESVINSNPPKVDFIADFSRESLHKIDEWLKENVTLVYLKEEDRDRIKESIDHPYLKHSAEDIVPKYRLSAQNMSLAFDIGAYMGEVFRRMYSEKLEWVCNSKTRKDDMFYLLPTVAGIDKLNDIYNLNPFAPGHVISLKYLKDKDNNFSFYGMIEKWENRFALK